MKDFGSAKETVAIPSSRRSSAEQLVAVVLIGVCVVAGAGVWIASRGGDHAELPTSAPAVTDDAAAQAAAPNNWQGQLDSEVDKLNRERTQQQRSADAQTLEQQQRDRERQDLDRRQRELAAQAAALAATQARPAAEPAKPTTVARSSGAVSSAPAQTETADALIPPRIISDSCKPPEYPSSAERMQQEGQVVLGYQIDPQGRVIDQRVDKSSGYAILDNAAAKALGRCRFVPATLNGAAQTAWAQVRFTWKISR